MSDPEIWSKLVQRICRNSGHHDWIRPGILFQAIASVKVWSAWSMISCSFFTENFQLFSLTSHRYAWAGPARPNLRNAEDSTAILIGPLINWPRMTTNDLDWIQVSKGCACVGSSRSCADSVVFSCFQLWQCFLLLDWTVSGCSSSQSWK